MFRSNAELAAGVRSTGIDEASVCQDQGVVLSCAHLYSIVLEIVNLQRLLLHTSSREAKLAVVVVSASEDPSSLIEETRMLMPCRSCLDEDLLLVGARILLEYDFLRPELVCLGVWHAKGSVSTLAPSVGFTS